MQTASKKVINGWAMYDWANSVYNLVITTTFFPIYFVAVTRNESGSDTVEFLGRSFKNTSLYDYTLALSYLLVVLSYPILTSIADTRGNKKQFLRFFCYMGALGCMSLFFFTKNNLGWGILSFMLAAMGYAGSLVFYNAYLPEIAAPEHRDRISARGFTFGYIGSVIMQLVGFALVVFLPDILGMSSGEGAGLATRITFLLVGLWWIGFAQIPFTRLPNGPQKTIKKGNIWKDGFREVKKVYGEVRQLPVLKRFLRGFFFYSMGVQTVMLAATLFGSKLLNLPDTKLIVTVVAIQLVAIPGAILMSRLSERFGNLRVLMGVVLFWVLICIAAYQTAAVAETLQEEHTAINLLKKQIESSSNAQETQQMEQLLVQKEKELSPQQSPVEFAFYGLAIAVGLVMGGIQSLSRSTYSKLMPETTDTASYFSYFDITEKLAIVLGMISFGLIDERFSMKNAVLSLIVFFAIGLIWLSSAQKIQKKLSS